MSDGAPEAVALLPAGIEVWRDDLEAPLVLARSLRTSRLPACWVNAHARRPRFRVGPSPGQRPRSVGAGGMSVGSEPGTVLIQRTLWLIGGRAAQIIFGAVALVCTIRSLQLGGFGDFSAAFAAASIVSGALGAAISDAVVTQRRRINGLPVLAVTLTVPVVIAVAAGIHDVDVTMSALAAGLLAVLAIANANRIANARLEGAAGRLALLQGIGSGMTAVGCASLLFLGVDKPAAYLLAYSFQPGIMFLLPDSQSQGRSGWRPTFHAAWSQSRPFIFGQAGWVIPSNVSILVVRVIEGPASAGAYASIVRLLDVLSVVSPLLGLFGLTSMRELWLHEARGAAQRAIARLNLLVAGVAGVALWASMPFAWMLWPLLYRDTDFPVGLFAVLAAAYSATVCFGLPDRVLQAKGSQEIVGRVSLSIGAAVIAGTVPLVAIFGAMGAGAVRVVGDTALNTELLRRAQLPRTAAYGHALLAVLLMLLCLALVPSAGSILGSAVVAVTGTVLAVVIPTASATLLRRGLSLDPPLR
jgi:O-antigen/teichoic acid export membrane protein